MVEYVLVSQGVEIYRTRDRDEAIKRVREMNNKYYKYAQMCIDNGEPYADNEVFLYEEEIRGKGLRYIKRADIMKA